MMTTGTPVAVRMRSLIWALTSVSPAICMPCQLRPHPGMPAHSMHSMSQAQPLFQHHHTVSLQGPAFPSHSSPHVSIDWPAQHWPT